MAKDSVAFSMDSSEAQALCGFITQLSQSFKTNAHLAPVVESAHAQMSVDFVEEMNNIARAAPENFHHVYEWGAIGVTQARLWKDVLRGRGADRLATFEWRASKTIVPIPDIENDPGKGTLKEIHVFVWKAPVMEYDMTVLVRPKESRFLAFPTGDPDNPLFFTQRSVRFNPGREQMYTGESRLRLHGGIGGNGTAGMFTRAYAAWWGGPGAEASFNAHIRQGLENDMGKMPIESAVAPFRVKNKTFKLNTLKDGQKAFQYGKQKAETWLVDRDRDYYAAARARRAFIGGDEIDE